MQNAVHTNFWHKFFKKATNCQKSLFLLLAVNFLSQKTICYRFFFRCTKSPAGGTAGLFAEGNLLHSPGKTVRAGTARRKAPGLFLEKHMKKRL